MLLLNACICVLRVERDDSTSKRTEATTDSRDQPEQGETTWLQRWHLMCTVP